MTEEYLWILLYSSTLFFSLVYFFLVVCLYYDSLATEAVLFSLPLQITKQQLQTTKDRFESFLKGDTQIVADEAFINAVQSYFEVQTELTILFSFTDQTDQYNF